MGPPEGRENWAQIWPRWPRLFLYLLKEIFNMWGEAPEVARDQLGALRSHRWIPAQVREGIRKCVLGSSWRSAWGWPAGAGAGGRGVDEGLVLPPRMAPRLHPSSHSPHSSRSLTDLGSGPISASCLAVRTWASDFTSLRLSFPVLTLMSVMSSAVPGVER